MVAQDGDRAERSFSERRGKRHMFTSRIWDRNPRGTSNVSIGMHAKRESCEGHSRESITKDGQDSGRGVVDEDVDELQEKKKTKTTRNKERKRRRSKKNNVID